MMTTETTTASTPAHQQAVPVDGFHLYDTTLRDGAQQEGLTLSVTDKLAVARLLDELGVTYIEGGWPGAVPRDTEFFLRARTELELSTARLAAFGSTRKAGVAVTDDPQRSEEHTAELQSRGHLVCRLLPEKIKRPASERRRGQYRQQPG